MTATASEWTPLAALAGRFAANLAALAGRHPGQAHALRSLAPAEPYAIRTVGDRVQLGVGAGPVRPVPVRVPPAVARETAAVLCPTGAVVCPLLVGGEDLGWLWDRLYRLPCGAATIPGWRPPLYFVAANLERLWVMLHVQDWATLLADPRVRLFAGPDAVDCLRAALLTDDACPWPQQWVTADPATWPAGTTVETLLAEADAARRVRLDGCRATANARRVPTWQAGRPLRVLGVTSRYTTFLQHSMRDWLAAFDRLGHATRLVIEGHDHEIHNELVTAAAIADFGPDLVVLIDHLRGGVGGVPPGVPVVAWVQDALPHLFTPAAGAAHGPVDYTMGLPKARLVRQFGYPGERFLTTPIPVRADRFAPPPGPRAPFDCDVSFVSHASTPADVLLRQATEQVSSPQVRRALEAVHDQLRATYAAGGCVTEPPAIRRLVDAALADAGCWVDESAMPAVMDLFVQRVNNALFRHQALAWVADMGVDLRLYGRGWERHPTLGRYARGPADHAGGLAGVYRASRINLHVSPFGAVHQRVFEGLAAGGFFLLRACPGDLMGRDYQALSDWCAAEGVTTDAQLRDRATPDVGARLTRLADALRSDPFGQFAPLVDLLATSAEAGHVGSAGTVWGGDYDAVRFDSAADVQRLVSRYLSDPADRDRRAESMRRPVLDRFTYVATTRRLLDLITTDLAAHGRPRAAA